MHSASDQRALIVPQTLAAPAELPAAPPTTPQAIMAWRAGRVLVTVHNGRLIDHCVRCNAPVGGERMRRKLAWHHPAIILTVLLGLLVYVILALILTKRATVSIGLCERHRRLRRRHILVSWLAVAVGVGLIALAIAVNEPLLVLPAFVALLGAAIYAIVTVAPVKPKRIDGPYVWLKGCGDEYLAAYPPWPYRP